MIKTIRSVLQASAFAATLFAIEPAIAAYPDHPVTIVVPWSAGGSADQIGRLVGKQISEQLDQPIVIENRPGATGTIGSCYVVRAKPDGYTLILNTNSTYAIVPHLHKTMACDISEGLTPIGFVAANQQVLAAHPSLGVKDLKSFLELLRSNPNKLAFGSSGVGGSSHLAMEQFLAMTKTEMLHVPYKGGSEALQSLLGNQVQVAFVDAGSALPVVRAGKIVALGGSGTEPVIGMDSIRPIRDLGVPEFQSHTEFALFAPAGTPQPAIEKLNQALNQAIQSESFKTQLIDSGFKPGGGTPAELIESIKSESDRWGAVIRSRGIQID